MEEVRWDVRALFQLVVFEMKLLSHLVPGDWIEETANPSLEGAAVLDRLHPKSSQPNFFLFVISPITIVKLIRGHQLQCISSERVE